MSRKLSGLAVLTLALCLLTGCSALLERTYSTAEPHSSKFWESEAAGTLRAENHQDVVNDLLLLVGRHQETATLRLYDFKSDLAVADTLEEAAAEVQQETPMGAYAVEFITTSSHAQRGYYEVAVRIGYRRTLQQLQAGGAVQPAGGGPGRGKDGAGGPHGLLGGKRRRPGGGGHGAAPGGAGADVNRPLGGELLSRRGESRPGGVPSGPAGAGGGRRARGGRRRAPQRRGGKLP